MPGGREDCEDAGDEFTECDAILTIDRQQWPVTELEKFKLESSDVDMYDCEDNINADPAKDKEEDTSQAEDGSRQNVEN